jgi:uncharacterized protein YfiM (DUF2279 family)
MRKAVKSVGIGMIAVFLCGFAAATVWADSGEDNWFGEDKAFHFVAGFLVETAAYNFYIRNTDSNSKAKTAAFFTSLAVGAAKELSDEQFSWKDLAWDAAGAGFGVAFKIEF